MSRTEIVRSRDFFWSVATPELQDVKNLREFEALSLLQPARRSALRKV